MKPSEIAKPGEIVKPRGAYHFGGNIAGGDPASYEAVLWADLIERYSIRTVLDVGCGIGRSMLCFEALGCRAIGIDGLERNATECPMPMILVDLTRKSIRVSGIDLVWSCEVAEHMPTKRIHHFVDTLLNGRHIAMTAAGPSDPGWHHRTCREPDYWIAMLEERGCRYLAEDTAWARERARGYFKERGLLFENRELATAVARRSERQMKGTHHDAERPDSNDHGMSGLVQDLRAT